MDNFNVLSVQWAIRDITKEKINGYEKAILFLLLACSGKNNLSWYSLQSLADLSCFSIDTIRRNLKTLEQKGFIYIQKPSSYGRAISNQYKLNIEGLMTYSRSKKGSLQLPFIGEKDSYQLPFKHKKGSSQQRKGSCQLGERVANSYPKNNNEEIYEEGETQRRVAQRSPAEIERSEWEGMNRETMKEKLESQFKKL